MTLVTEGQVVGEIGQGLEGPQVGGRGQLTGAVSSQEKPGWADSCHR